jgi:hypothetical protein
MSKSNQGNGDSRRPLDGEAIARRAYELYLQRGSVPGYELDDWLAAEAELTAAASIQGNGTNDEIGGRRDARQTDGASDNRRPTSRERTSPRRALRQ